MIMYDPEHYTDGLGAGGTGGNNRHEIPHATALGEEYAWEVWFCCQGGGLNSAPLGNPSILRAANRGTDVCTTINLAAQVGAAETKEEV